MALSLRQADIIEIARREGRVSVDGLAARFGVTLQTVRRDLAELSTAGKLERVHGGAVLPSGLSNIEYEARRNLNAAAKDRIGRACAARIAEGTSLFLAIGTTTEAVARALLEHEKLLVVTNNINVASILTGNPGCEVIVTGGILRPSDGGLVGDVTAEMAAQFKLDLAVIGASAIDTDGDLLDYDYREVRVSQTMLRQARGRMVVADGSKFQRHAPVRVGDLSGLDAFVTDRAPPAPVARACEGWGTEVLVA